MPMRQVAGLAAVIVVVVAACASPDATADPQTSMQQDEAAPDSVRDQVMAVVEQYYADLSAREWEFVRGHFWPGAAMSTVWQPTGEPDERVVNTTIEEFIAQAPQGPGSRAIFAETMTSAHVRANNAIAQVWTTYDARFGDPGDIMEWSGIDALTLLHFDGRWRISSLAWVSTEGDTPR